MNTAVDGAVFLCGLPAAIRTEYTASLYLIVSSFAGIVNVPFPLTKGNCEGFTKNQALFCTIMPNNL